MFPTSDTTHSVREPDRNVPKWYELKPTMLLGRIVGRTFFAAFGTNALRILSGFYLNNDDFRPGFILTKNVIVNFCENEGLVIGDKIESLFQLHLGLADEGKYRCENQHFTFS
jgi:hypothetical protein